jgi:hypothetical protein
MDLFASWEPLVEKLGQEGMTGGMESPNRLSMAISNNLGEGCFEVWSLP